MKPELNPKLSHLSEVQVEALIARYYAGSKASDLVTEFGIEARAGDLSKLFPAKVIELQCPHCAHELWQNRSSKSSYKTPRPHCPACGHEHTDGTYRRCGCDGCRKRVAEVEAAIEAKKRALVEQSYPLFPLWENPNVQHLASQLTLRDAVFISALYRNADIDSSGTAGAPFAKDRPLSPTTDLTKAMLAHLGSRGLVRVSAASALDSFEFHNEVTRVSAHYIFKVRYRLFPMLPVVMIGDVIRTIDEMADDGFWLQEDDAMNAALGLWKELALHECLESFEHQGQLHKLQPPSGEKTIVTFQALLEDLSVAQVYNIVWGAARNAAAYYQRGGVSKQQASNSMVGGCRTRADKAKVSGWEIKPYGRNFERPRSELSHVLHEVFLKIGDKGFSEKPSRDTLGPF